MSNDLLQPTYNKDDVEILSREPLHTGFFRTDELHYRYRHFRGGWSQVVKRELFCRGNAVAAVLYDPRMDCVGLIEQIRTGAIADPRGPWCLEVVAGMIKPEESPEDVVWREIQEETHVAPARVEYICDYYTSPGGCDEKVHLYCALADLSEVHDSVSGLDDEHEDIRTLVIPTNVVFENLYDGRFDNGATLICLQWLQLNHDRLRHSST